jgi:hypothetical protein
MLQTNSEEFSLNFIDVMNLQVYIHVNMRVHWMKIFCMKYSGLNDVWHI